MKLTDFKTREADERPNVADSDERHPVFTAGVRLAAGAAEEDAAEDNELVLPKE